MSTVDPEVSIQPNSPAPRGKRIFDLIVCIATAPLWIPALIICGFAILIFSGRPIFYSSTRRVSKTQSIRLVKLRTMVKNAERLANRETVPVKGQRFLNIPFDSPLYTRIGRLIERCCLTELPQLFHILSDQMNLVGNRPLPSNVIESLRAEFPFVEQRFLVRSGMTGPVQLVGRDQLSDNDRLRLEITYCRVCINSYSFRLDFILLLYTVLIGIKLHRSLSVDEVERLMMRRVGTLGTQTREKQDQRPSQAEQKREKESQKKAVKDTFPTEKSILGRL